MPNVHGDRAAMRAVARNFAEEVYHLCQRDETNVADVTPNMAVELAMTMTAAAVSYGDQNPKLTEVWQDNAFVEEFKQRWAGMQFHAARVAAVRAGGK